MQIPYVPVRSINNDTPLIDLKFAFVHFFHSAYFL